MQGYFGYLILVLLSVSAILFSLHLVICILESQVRVSVKVFVQLLSCSGSLLNLEVHNLLPIMLPTGGRQHGSNAPSWGEARQSAAQSQGKVRRQHPEDCGFNMCHLSSCSRFSLCIRFKGLISVQFHVHSIFLFSFTCDQDSIGLYCLLSLGSHPFHNVFACMNDILFGEIWDETCINTSNVIGFSGPNLLINHLELELIKIYLLSNYWNLKLLIVNLLEIMRSCIFHWWFQGMCE